MRHTVKDEENIEKLTEQFGSEYRSEIERLYKGQVGSAKRLVSRMISDLAYEFTGVMMKTRTSVPVTPIEERSAVSARDDRFRLFLELANRLCPDYISGLSSTVSILNVSHQFQENELKDYIAQVDKYLAFPSRRRGRRPVYFHGDFEYMGKLKSYIERNLKIKLPRNMPNKFYDSVADNLGL